MDEPAVTPQQFLRDRTSLRVRPKQPPQLCGVASILLPVCSASSLLPVGER